jgi:hypothetical protein
MKQLTVIAILCALVGCERPTLRVPTTITTDGSLSDVQAKVNAAVDGDVLTLPSGTFTWTNTLNVTKAVTFKGNSTADPHCGGGSWENAGDCRKPFKGDPPPNTHSDNTKIVCAVPSNSKLVEFKVNTGQYVRWTGTSIMATASNPQISSIFENDGRTPFRIDNNYIDKVNVVANIVWNNQYNDFLIDHNVSICEHGWVQNGPGRQDGDEGDSAFEKAVDFSTTKGWGTVEDCWGKHGGDIVWGGQTLVRYVHNHGETTLGPPAPGTVVGAVWVDHGTGRQGNGRGGRAYHFIKCDFWWNDANKIMDGSDSGAAVWQGCIVGNNGKTIGSGDGGWIGLNGYRSGIPNNAPYYTVNGMPGKTWDDIEKDANGNTKVYASGTSASGTGGGTIVVSGANWQPHQWVGYGARRSDGQAAGINDNTNNSLNTFSVGFNMGWSPGQTIEIIKPLRYLDQTGVGKGDHINRSSPKWPNPVDEPLYVWNCVNVDNGQQLGYIRPPPYLKFMVVEGRDFFNNTVKPGYVEPPYPHPLIAISSGGGGSSPTASPVVSPTATPTAIPSPTAAVTPPVGNGVDQSLLNGAVLYGSSEWTATVSGAAVAKVKFFIDGVEKWTEGAPPYFYNGDNQKLDTKTLSDGTHSFKVTSYDSGQNVLATSVINATVSNNASPSPSPLPTPTPTATATAAPTATATTVPSPSPTPPTVKVTVEVPPGVNASVTVITKP